ncbi:helix-turn-helix domain-containing protein [Enterococcus sp. BWB1-3]|uniref:XRE family transcriptional regulator n=1 Tax=unclassified Enterococcus TaxID=2608891 RepID=UPI0019219CA8|nr:MULTISPECIES: XRE family transcriptional regulator [unclassified Enterococcus]MBL1229566.1 helix-turn-helix domain-containing protein [Enterococcus sp. BWB1-3]MCB5950744.1 XRE family transcriptional regulator [Enterococcus sp. BWT-B8]MCB5955983.1 XRE family transcriptional regulator [Enterococcus sp. CWB-B31]
MEFRKIKDLRKSKKITLTELGDKTGYSASFLSQIERGVNRPSLEALRKIAEALDVSVASLMANEAPTVNQSMEKMKYEYRIIRNSSETLYSPWQSNSTYYDTLFNLPVHTENMVISKIYIDAHSSSSGQMISHNLSEINHVIKGKATIFLEGEQHQLNVGDTIFLGAFTKHNIMNETEDELLLFTLQF